MNRIDQMLRLAVGAGCLYVGLVATELIDHALINSLIALFGAINLFAGVTAHCPIYALAGVGTHRRGRAAGVDS